MALATTSVDIYLGHKASATFSSTSDYMTETNLTHVYHGSPTLGRSTGWETIGFNVADFEYNGTDNLVVVVCRKSTYSTSNLCYYEKNVDNTTLCRYDNSTESYGEISSTSNYSLLPYRPTAKILYGPNISVTDVVLTDADEYTYSENTAVMSATYKKTLGSDRVGKYQAWFVPFDYTITAADLLKFDFFKINMIANAAQPGENPASDDVYIFLNPITTAGTMLYGNKPYVYRPKVAVTDYPFTTENATMLAENTSSVLQTSTTTATYDFYGTYQNTLATTENPFYYVSAEGNICKGTTVTVGPYRWILRATSKNGVSYARTISFVENNVTGIHSIENGELKIENSEVYNLQGRRVTQPTKGLYIVNGRKMVIK